MIRRSPWLPIAFGIAAAVVVEAIFIGRGWFFLDDIRNLADARREGLTWSFLTEPIGAEHLSPGHRLLDWLVAVPLGRSWAWATALVIAWSVLGLAYLAATMRRLFGPSPWHAVPVFLAGSAWPLLGTGQWFAGAGLAVPAFAAISAALFHHVSARTGGSPRHAAAAVVWIVVGLAFSIQAVFAPVLLLIVVVACAWPLSARDAGREVVALLPLAVPALAFALYVALQPWAPASTVPSPGDAVALAATVALRGTLPSIVGIGLSAGGAEPGRETTMQLLAGLVLAGGFALAVLRRRRWVVAAVLMLGGVVVTSAIVAFGRLTVLPPRAAGIEPRYLLPAVLMGALGIAALMTPQVGAPAAAPASRGIRLAAAALAAALALLYASNLQHTSQARSYSVDTGQAARRMTKVLSASIAAAFADGRGASITDGELPPPLFYSDQLTNRLSAFSRFFTSRELPATAVPFEGHVLRVGPDGRLRPERFSTAVPSLRCGASRTTCGQTRLHLKADART